ncbi:unnamed protein product [Zymoseptoria tritici ST99CH_1A5]|uniref:Uncharacterized protein n=3 Tax=Zymoseptoria tritici TaxID=1047171 RepID=A0A1X7RYF5_ZYMT9|nr:unnamed protein product [Zymoseptoria tritici ST99CH_3D7]SMR55298.1 unnamed protein product [Zymoseptoria tritici ST99CH_1E4]SMY26111.1 unnamed protein product [Zymoseptoria tritici ST99CH_1A5]
MKSFLLSATMALLLTALPLASADCWGNATAITLLALPDGQDPQQSDLVHLSISRIGTKRGRLLVVMSPWSFCLDCVLGLRAWTVCLECAAVSPCALNTRYIEHYIHSGT